MKHLSIKSLTPRIYAVNLTTQKGREIQGDYEAGFNDCMTQVLDVLETMPETTIRIVEKKVIAPHRCNHREFKKTVIERLGWLQFRARAENESFERYTQRRTGFEAGVRKSLKIVRGTPLQEPPTE